MRVNLLFGFLGSGKTTLVRRILAERGGARPMAVIVNEFGDVGVDGEIIAGKNVDLVELTSGCLCCTLRGSLTSAVEELRERAGVEQILVEATGVASPGDMLEDLLDARVRAELDVGPLVTVVDAPRFTRLREMLGEFYEEQVENADVLLLNKVDRASAEQLTEAEAAVRAINPDAILLHAEHGDTDLALLLDGPESELLAQIREELGLPATDAGHADGNDHDHGHAHAHAESVVLDATGDFDPVRLRAAFEALPDTVWRAKGFLYADGEPTLLQHAVGQFELTPAERPRKSPYVVVIGTDLDRTALESALASARRAGA